MQPVLHREGYGIFVRCCDLSSETPLAEFVSAIDSLDEILCGQIGEQKDDFFPNPYGGAIYRGDIDDALGAARALSGGLSAAGISAGIGVAQGRFQRTDNVQDWNAAALPLNQAARLAFCDAAKGHVLTTPHVRKNADASVEFSDDERDCVVKGKQYAYHAVESPEYTQHLAARKQAAEAPKTWTTNIVLWDIVKYSAQNSDAQAELSHALAQTTATALHIFNARPEHYSPTGDGGFALFDTGLKAIAFAKELGRRAAYRGITIRTGISHGPVGLARCKRRGFVGPGVLRADAISAQASSNGIAILEDVWNNLDKISQEDWRTAEIAPGILRLEVKSGAAIIPLPPTTWLQLTATDRTILVNALSDIPQFGSVTERWTFIQMVVSEYPLGDEANKTLGYLNWEGPPVVVAYYLVRLLEAQELAPGVPALRVLAEAVEPFAGMAHREGLAGLRRRL